MSNCKRVVALGIATVMVFGSSLTVFATENNIAPTDGSLAPTAAKTVEGEGSATYINKKVFKVIAPTDELAGALFDYVTDPQGLIAATGAAAHNNMALADDTGVFFTNTAEDGTTKYLSSWSDPLKLTNKSTSGVGMAIEAKLVQADTDPYTAGYSTTPDFSETGEDEMGVYLGILATGDKQTGLGTTKVDITGYARSAYTLYEVGYASNAYTFEIPEANQGNIPVYEIRVNGILNRAVADTKWYKKGTNPLSYEKALAMPKIEIKYTPTYIDAKQCGAAFDGENLYVYNLDGTGFGKEAALTANSFKINYAAATTAVTKCSTDGILIIPAAEVYTALGLTGDDKTLENAAARLTGVEATIGGVAVYANVDF